MAADAVNSSVSFRQFDSYADFPAAANMDLGALAWAQNVSGLNAAGLYVVRQSAPNVYAWSPLSSGGGGLPAGMNGGVLAYAGGAWASTAPGTAGQLLSSNGAAAPTWLTVTAADVGAVPTSRTLTAGTGLTGGGDLSADLSFAVLFGVTGTTACVGNDARLSDARVPSTAGSDGGAMVYAAGAWASTAAGTVGQLLSSNGAAAPTWATVTATSLGAVPTSRTLTASTGLTGGGALSADLSFAVLFGSTSATACVGDDARLSDARTPIVSVSYTWTAAQTVAVNDAVTNAVTTVMTFSHTTSGTAAAGLGTRILLQAEDAGGANENAAAIDAVWTNAGAATEASAIDLSVRTGGAVLTRAARLVPEGLTVGNLATVPAAQTGINLSWALRGMAVRTSLDTAWIDVWRVNGSNVSVFGSIDGTNSGGVDINFPTAGAFRAMRNGATAYLNVTSAGAMTVGAGSGGALTLTGSTILITPTTTMTVGAAFPLTLTGTTVVLTATTSLTVNAAPVAIINDGVTNAVTTLLTLRHNTTGTAAVGIGTRILLQSEDAGGADENVAAIDGTLTNAGAATEASALDLLVRTGGAVLTRAARVAPEGFTVGAISSVPTTTTGINLSWAMRGMAVRNSLDTTWIDVWRANGSNVWVFGSDDATNSGGAWLQAASNAEIALRRGTNNHVFISSGTGALTLGTLAHATTIQGTTITASAAPVVAVDDAANAAITTMLTLRHTTPLGAAAGIGARVLMQLEDGGGATEDAGSIETSFTNAGAATEASQMDFFTRTGGAALARVLRLYPSGGIGIGNSGTLNDNGNGSITIPVTTGIYVSSGGTSYTVAGVFGSSSLVFGSGAFAVQLNGFNLSISAAAGTVLTNGWLTLSAAAGYRTIPTPAVNTNVTATANTYTFEVTGLTAARVVTLPAHVAGTRVMVFCSDGSCGVVNTITITPASGNINGAANFVLTTAYTVCEVISNGTSWTVVHTR